MVHANKRLKSMHATMSLPGLLLFNVIFCHTLHTASGSGQGDFPVIIGAVLTQ